MGPKPISGRENFSTPRVRKTVSQEVVMRVILFCLVLPFLGTYSVPTGRACATMVDNVCVRMCDINYQECVEKGAFKETCRSIYKRCVRKCKRDAEKDEKKTRSAGTLW